MKCPVCKTKLDINVNAIHKFERKNPQDWQDKEVEAVEFFLEIKEDLESNIRRLLMSYMRMVFIKYMKESVLQNFSSSTNITQINMPSKLVNKGDKIWLLEDLETYAFSIQIYDSPEGDSWIDGTFKLGYLDIVELKFEKEIC